MPNLVSVDIQTGRVLEDNLREWWDAQSRGLEAVAAGRHRSRPAGAGHCRADCCREPAGAGHCSEPALPGCRPPAAADTAAGPHGTPNRLPAPVDEALRERVRKFNTGRRRRNKNAWSDDELYRLAVLMGRQKRTYKQAAARLARTPRACQCMFREMTKAGVI